MATIRRSQAARLLTTAEHCPDGKRQGNQNWANGKDGIGQRRGAAVKHRLGFLHVDQKDLTHGFINLAIGTSKETWEQGCHHPDGDHAKDATGKKPCADAGAGPAPVEHQNQPCRNSKCGPPGQSGQARGDRARQETSPAGAARSPGQSASQQQGPARRCTRHARHRVHP